MSKPIDPRLVELIKQQESSGQSIAAFAREHGEPKWKFYEGRRALRDCDSEFIEVDVAPLQVSVQPLEIVLPGNLLIRVSPDFDSAAVCRLVEVLRSC